MSDGFARVLRLGGDASRGALCSTKAEEKTAEEGDLSSSVLDKALHLILRRLPG